MEMDRRCGLSSLFFRYYNRQMNWLWQTMRMVRQADRRSFCCRVCYVLLQSVLPLCNVYLLKLLVDAVAYGSQRWIGWLLGMVAVMLANRVVGALLRVNGDVMSQRVADYMSDVIQRQAARLDMAYYDSPDYHDTLHRAQQEATSRPLAVMDNMLSVAGSLISSVIVMVLLAGTSWWTVVVLVAAVLPSFAVRLHKARRIYFFRRENTSLYRRTAYYGSLLTGRAWAAEMRTLRLAPHFRRLFVEVRQRLVGSMLKISRRMGAADVLCGIVEAAAMLAVVGLLAGQAVAGAVSVGTFVMLFEAYRRGQGYLTALVNGTAALYDSRLFVSNMFEFLQLQPALTVDDAPLPVPEHIEEVSLEDVTFRYPDMDRDVLSHYNLRARAGEVTLLEGENGRGKSTVLKLLLRLYDPVEGMVKVNGVDVRRFRPDEWRSHTGVLFQDFVRYQCTLRDNVSLGDVDHPDRPVDTALSAAGADSVAASLPQGTDTMLGRMFEGGHELSMGQWQRLALARALQSDAPVVLLDEPTAWLDSEGRRHFEDTLERLKQQNKIVILVRHK